MKSSKIIITPEGKISNPHALDINFMAPASDAACSRCDRPATPYTTPPLCEFHLDLLMLISDMQKHNILITLANVQQHLQNALAQGGQWALTAADLPGLLDDLLTGESK